MDVFTKITYAGAAIPQAMVGWLHRHNPPVAIHSYLNKTQTCKTVAISLL